MGSPPPMPHFAGWDATLHGGKCHTWSMLRCGIRDAEVWHSERWRVAFRMPECGVSAGFLLRPFRRRRLLLRSPRTGRLVPEGGIIRSGRRSVGDGAAQVGALAVRQLLVAVGVGRCGGRLLLFEALQQHMQFLRGALAGPYEVDEILSGVFHVQQHIAIVVQYDVLPEYLHSLFDVRL